MLDNQRAANLLQNILDEEKETGHVLNHLAFHRNNGGLKEAGSATGRKPLGEFDWNLTIVHQPSRRVKSADMVNH